MVSLREVRESDKEQMRQWRNSPEVARYMYTDHFITPEEHDAWFRSILNNPSCRYWIIEWNGRGVGVAHIYAIDRRHRRCSWGLYLASPEVRGQGVGAAVQYLVLRHAFEDLGLNKVSCEALAGNQRALALYRNFGFQEEGRLREHVIKNGRPADVVLLALLRAQWERQRPAMEQRLRDRGLLPAG